jgi:ADP-ribose pyrophosphatase
MSRTIVYEGPRFRVGRVATPLLDGGTLHRDMVVHPGAVAILPVVDAGHVCLLRQHRFAIGATLWEIPAGTLEPGEAPQSAAERELAEETGYRAASLRPLADFFPSPGILDERMYLFVAEGLTPGATDLQPGEDIRPEVVPWEQALSWARDGTIRDAKTLIALLLWQKG